MQWQQLMDQKFPRQEEQQNEGDEDDAFSDDPTPVPASSRPPPPTFQEAMSYQQQQNDNNAAVAASAAVDASMMSAMLSFSGNVESGDLHTLPSLALEPPSPLSKPSESLMLSTSVSESQQQPLSMARQQQRQSRNKAPVQEVVVDSESHDQQPQNTSIYTTPKSHDEEDTFFDDPSLEQRAKRTLQHPSPKESTVLSSSQNNSSHPQPQHRSLLSSPDAQPRMPQQGQVRKDSMHNISAMSSFSVSQPQRTANDTHISGDEVVRVHESALHALQQLKEELVKANQRNDQLVQQQQQWQNEQQQLRQQVDGLRQQSAHDRDEIARLRQDCQQCQTQKDTLVTTQHRLTQEKMDLEGQLRESNRSTKELRHRTLASDNRHKELRGQLDKLNRELEEALSAKGDLTAELDALQAERVEAHTEMARLKAQLADMALERDQSQTEAKKLQEELQSTQDRLQQVHTSSEREIDRLNKALRKANDTMHKMRAEMISKARMAKNMAFSPQFQAGVTPRVHPGSSTLLDAPTASTTAVPPPNLDSAIADRLARLRDSAERAHLIRAHKRELAKIKADRDGAIQQLEVEHADVLKKLTKQHEAKRTTQVEEVTQRMQRQYESQLEDMEEEHRKKISQLQKDYGKLQEDSDESLQEALSRVARVTQDFEREASRRKALERNVEDLQQQMQMEKRETQAHFTEELERRRREWENERDSMMGSLQKDVNVAFDSRRRSFKSPRHAAAATSTPMSTTGSPRHYYPPLSSQQPHQPPRPSPLSMNSAAAFFPDKTTVDNDSPIYGGGAAYIAPSPSRQSSPSETGNGGGPPSMISQSYSDIDSVLRETEELVQSIMS